jgi:hypothetical protein
MLRAVPITTRPRDLLPIYKTIDEYLKAGGRMLKR